MMTPELAKRLALVFPTAGSQGTGVACVAGVADATRYASKPAELRQLRPLRHEVGNAGRTANEGVAADVAPPLAPDADAIEERAALAADCVPARYLDAWARLNHQKPARVTEAEWRLALDRGGRFLDVWGKRAAALGWSVDALFDAPRDGAAGGLIWRLDGADVIELRAHSVRTKDERIVANET
jgi:hypothetical protein